MPSDPASSAADVSPLERTDLQPPKFKTVKAKKAKAGAFIENPEITIPGALKTEKKFEFDTTKYQWSGLVLDALQVDCGEIERALEALDSPEWARQKVAARPLSPEDYLSLLHLTAAGRYCQQNPPRSGHDPFRRRWMDVWSNSDKAMRNKISVLLSKYVEDVLGPHLDADLASSSEELEEKGVCHPPAVTCPRVSALLAEKSYIYQTEASLRVHLPQTTALGVPHTDSDYFHQPGEINFWFPVNETVGGENSLFCESVSKKGDFHSFDVRYGAGVRFYGNKCRHYTVRNGSDRTRVSLDIRVIPARLYCDEWKGARGHVPFRVGGYYSAV